MGAVETADVIFLILALSVLIAAAMFRIHSRLSTRLDELNGRIERQRAEFVSLQHLAREVYDASALTRQRELELVEQVAQLARQQEQMLVRDADSSPYFQAIRSAKSGASAESLVGTYGLSQGEAELVVALHRPSADEPD